MLGREKSGSFLLMRSEMRNWTGYQFISTLDHKMELSSSLVARNNILHIVANLELLGFALNSYFFLGEEEDMIK